MGLSLPAGEIKVVVCVGHVGEFWFRHGVRNKKETLDVVADDDKDGSGSVQASYDWENDKAGNNDDEDEDDDQN